MNQEPDPVQMYSSQTDRYHRFVAFFRYTAGIRAFFLRSPHARSGLRVLDAGCGSGIVTLAFRDALLQRGLVPGTFHAFDLTPAMLDRFREALRRDGIQGIDLAQADVLELNQLPTSWTDYDLILSASMLEYIPRQSLSVAIRGLRSRLKKGGNLVLFISRRNWLTRPLIGRWWHANLYKKRELEEAFHDAGFASINLRRFPGRFRFLSLWGHIVEARNID